MSIHTGWADLLAGFVTVRAWIDDGKLRHTSFRESESARVMRRVLKLAQRKTRSGLDPTHSRSTKWQTYAQRTRHVLFSENGHRRND